MELMACIKGLEILKYPCEVTITSDSEYVVNGISKGWAKNWQKNNWIRSEKKEAKNIDLWKQLLSLTEYHVTHFVWIRGHEGHEENEGEAGTSAAAGAGTGAGRVCRNVAS